MRRPSRLELMSFADGELDDARAAEIERWLEGDAQAQAFIESLEVLGGVVRGEVAVRLEQSGGAPFDAADAIMAAIDAEPASLPEPAAAPALRRVPALAPAPPDSLQIPPAASHPAGIIPLPSRASRRNPGAGTGLLLATFAAAAGLLLWLNRGAEPAPRMATTEPDAMLVASATLPSEDEPSRGDGTAVDTVDFGQHLGAIFYVAGSTRASTTTVVWISDDEDSP
jgi:anti-sigma factor RsiW